MRMPALAVTLIAATLGPSSVAAEPVALFLGPPLVGAADAPALTMAQRDRLARLRAEPAVLTVSVVRVAPGALTATSLSLNLPGQVPRTVGKQAADAASWQGEDAAAGATLARGRDGVTGSVRVAGSSFAVRPLGGGLHALVERDFSRLPPDHPPGVAGLPVPTAERQRAAATERDAPRAAADTAARYRVLVAYTRQAEAAVGDMAGLAALAVAETNAAYANSGIATRAQLAGLHRVEGGEALSISSDLAALQRNGDGRFDYVHVRRDQWAADVVVLIGTHVDACGLGYLDAPETYAFAAVNYGCATGYYSFAHEIGHIQGARHNPEIDPASTPFAYGHGYQDAAAGFRTVMSYDCPLGCLRVQHFSNPTMSYNGHPTGTATRHDNARVINEMASRVANFRVSVPTQ